MDVKGPLGTTTIEEHTRLHARAHSCTRRVLVKGGTSVCMRAQARNADVPTKFNLRFPGVN